MNKRTNWLLGTLGFLSVLTVAGIVFAISSIPTAGDHQRANLLLDELESRFEFTTMIEKENRPAIFCVGLSRSDHIEIYGSYSKKEISEISSILSEAQIRRQDRMKIEVCFFSILHDESSLYRKVVID